MTEFQSLASKPHWIIQTNMGADSDIGDYVEAIRASGAEIIEVHVKPFSNELPDVQLDGPTVVYGAVGFVNDAQKSGRWSPGVFATPDVFTYDNWVRHYGDMLLNSSDSTERTTVGDFANSNRDGEDLVFVRPQHDTKSIVGEVLSVDSFRNWCQDACKGDYAGVDATTAIVVGQPHGIEAEWRLFMVDGEVVGASQYRKSGRLHRECGAPDLVLAFAKKAEARWSPASAYVLQFVWTLCHRSRAGYPSRQSRCRKRLESQTRLAGC
jgi:hypothetical protein